MSSGSLGDIQRDLRDHLGVYFTINEDLYKGSDISISNFLTSSHDRDYFFKKHKYNVLIQPIDGTVIFKHKVDTINKFSLVITPGNAGKDILIKNGVTAPIKVIPNYFKECNLHAKNTSNKIIFYHESKLYKRKNLSGLYNAFLNAFADSKLYDKVKLVIKTDCGNALNEIQTYTHSYTNIPEIEVIDAYYSEEELYQLWIDADIYISFSHMEGFGIPLLNFAAMGKPVITLKSDISGYMDFLNDTNCYFVESRRVTDTDFATLYTAESEWDDIENVDNCKNVILEAVFDFVMKSQKTVAPNDIVNYTRDSVMNAYSELFFSLLNIKKPAIKQRLTIIGPLAIGDGLGRVSSLIAKSLNNTFDIKIVSLNEDDVFKKWDHYTEIQKLVVPLQQVSHKTPILSTGILWAPGGHPYAFTHDIFKNEQWKNTPRFVISMFESTKIPDEWVNIINDCYTGVLVPCDYLVGVYKNSGVKIPVYVLPLPVEGIGDAIEKTLASSVFEKNKQFVFGYIAGTWARKRVLETMQTFISVFGDRKDVSLRVHSRFGEHDVSKAVIEYSGLHENIHFTYGVIPESEMSEIKKNMDCYLMPSSGEGFSYTPREMLALGKPCIISSGHAHTVIIEEEGAIGIKNTSTAIAKKSLAFDDIDGSIGEDWPPDMKDFAYKMKWVYNNYEKAQIHVRDNIHVLRRYTPEGWAETYGTKLMEFINLANS